MLQKLTLDLRPKKTPVKPGSIGYLELEITFRTFKDRADPQSSASPLFTTLPSIKLTSSAPDLARRDRSSSVPSPYPDRKISLSIRDGSGLLEVLILKGTNLEPYRDGNIASYCKIFIGSDVRRTRVGVAWRNHVLLLRRLTELPCPSGGSRPEQPPLERGV